MSNLKHIDYIFENDIDSQEPKTFNAVVNNDDI